MTVCVVGAGFSGGVLARCLAEAGLDVLVIDQRAHVGGNCYTYRDPDTNIIIHKYGPHIFHTANEQVWSYVNHFGEFKPYLHRVKATLRGRVYSLPINLHTLNQFFDTSMSPEQAEAYVSKLAGSSPEKPKNFEEQALSLFGRELYEAFFKGYTHKQWGCEPRQLPSDILKRLPFRFDYNDNYYSHPHQGMPVNGYTPIFENILDHGRIRVELNQPFKSEMADHFDHVFYTGQLDAYFDFEYGRLGYRTLDFEVLRGEGDYQGCAVMNYPDEGVPYTRITEHKHFSPWEEHHQTVYFREYSRACGESDIPFYPLRLLEEKVLLKRYVELAELANKVTFLGRLGTYRYLDMDVTIHEALLTAKSFLLDLKNKTVPKAFYTPPL